MKTKLSFHLPIFLLSLFGLVAVFSLIPQRLLAQLLFLIIGFGFYFYFQNQDSALFVNLGPYLYLLALFLLVFTLIFGQHIRGSVRWLTFGSFRFQASELVKPLLILSYANFMTRWPPTKLRHILINILLGALPIGLIFLEPDLGTAIIHFLIWFTMLFLAGLPVFFLFFFFLIFVIFGGLAPHLLQPYQLERLMTFLEPQRDPLGAGYNVIQAMITVGSGKFWGQGLGRGTQAQLHFLPERHTDFVFASLAEEFGFLGVIALMGSFVWLLFNLLNLSRHQLNSAYQLVIGGIFAYLFSQASLNLAMNLGLAPVTGVTLPLISYGGSSLLATLISLGIAASIMNKIHAQADLEIK